MISVWGHARTYGFPFPLTACVMKYLVCEIDSNEMKRRRRRRGLQIFLPSGDRENRSGCRFRLSSPSVIHPRPAASYYATRVMLRRTISCATMGSPKNRRGISWDYSIRSTEMWRLNVTSILSTTFLILRIIAGITFGLYHLLSEIGEENVYIVYPALCKNYL